MRALKAIIALMFAMAGILIGALNQQTVEINLGFSHYQSRLGLLLLLCVLFGAVLGGALASLGLLLRGGAWLPPGKPAKTAEADPERKP